MSLDTIEYERLNLQPGDLLLDLGCGEGRHTIGAYLQAPITAIGIDLGLQDLATASSRLADFPDGEGSCHFAAGSGLTLPFADNTFSHVICSEVLEHVPDYQSVISEIRRVLRPGGVFAVSVPRRFPEWVCWQLSDAYHAEEGGHIRIFTSRQLHDAVSSQQMQRFAKHWAHSLHVPYWWLRCLFWRAGEQFWLTRMYHKLLVWDLMKQPRITRWLDRMANPILGKSVAMYYVSNKT